MRIIVTGLIGQYPFGGVIWDYIQYVLGFRSLGHDVLYLEDTGVWPYDPLKETISEDCSYQVNALAGIFADFDLSERWVYRNAADGKFHGAGEVVARDWVRHADVLVNVSTASWLTDYDVGVGQQIFIDGDPMFTQIGMFDDAKDDYTQRLRKHDSHFSFGLNLGVSDCLVPDTGIHWRPTLQPVCMDHWQPLEMTAPPRFTTVMNWVSYPPKLWNGAQFGQKDTEFMRFLDLPRHVDVPMVIAMGQGIGRQRPTATILEHGWQILEPDEHLPDHRSYRKFINDSTGEWSIAKHGYVAAHTGWFSCRTACYLAAGRPAVVQDTGWSKHLPHGMGLLPFVTLEEASDAINKVTRDYATHCRAAREFAEEFLDARKVCAKLLSDSGIS